MNINRLENWRQPEKAVRWLLVLLIFSWGLLSCEGNQEQVIHLAEKGVIPNPEASKNCSLASLRSLQIDDEGSVYVLDPKDKKVKVFDVRGSCLYEFGKFGQGPGEFQSPTDIFLYGKILSVFDMGNKRSCQYSLAGEHLGDVDLRSLPGMFRPEAEDEEALYGNMIEYAEDGRDILKLIKYDKKTKSLTTIYEVKPEHAFPGLNPLEVTFKLRLQTDKTLVWVYPENYVIYLMTEDGKKVKEIVQKYNRVEVTSEDKDKLLTEIFGGKEKITPGFNIVWPKYFPPVSSLLVDESNNYIYVETNEKNKQAEIKYDVFDDSGSFRGSFYHGEPIRQIKNNMAYIVSEDAEGCPMIKQYEIHFEPSPHLIRGAGLLAKPGEGCLLAFLRSREGLPAWPR